MNNLGTWIDWQYLQNAAKLLAKVGICVSLSKGENLHTKHFHLKSILEGRRFWGYICTGYHALSQERKPDSNAWG